MTSGATSVDVAAYAERIGYRGVLQPTPETLRALHRLHPSAIPFENLTTLLGDSPPLDVARLERKMVAGGRGGYCFEHNRLFAAVLESLGFDVTALAARVMWERDAGSPMPRTHMLLLVDVAGVAHVADVGFGGLTLTAPLRLEPDIVQETPHEAFRLLRADAGFVLEARLNAEWRPLYWFDESPYLDVDFEVLNHFVATHSSSPFRSNLLGARTLPDRRIGLRNGRLSVRRLDGTVERRELESPDALREALAADFGIRLPEDARLDAALARVALSAEG